VTRARSRRLDVRLALPAATGWAAAAVLQPMPAGAAMRVALAAAAMTVVGLLRRRVVVAAALLGVAAGSAAVGVHVLALHRGATAGLAAAHASATVDLLVTRDPAVATSAHGKTFSVVDGTVTSVSRTASSAAVRDRAPVVVFTMSRQWADLLPGQRLRAEVRLEPSRTGDTVAAVAVASGAPELLGTPPVWQRWSGSVRSAFRTACARLPPDVAGLVPGLVLGDVTAMPAALATDFRTTGLTHLTAVSGENVAILMGAVAAGLRRSRCGRVLRAVLCGLVLLGFVVLVRPSPSVLRAAVMGAVVLVGTLTGRRSRAIPALAAAVLLLVLVDPFLARTPGFAMSVLATAAIILVAPAWTDRLARRMPRALAAAVAVPAAAQLACTPVIAVAFGQLTPYAIPANLLAAPAVAPATLVGMAVALTSVALPSVAAGLAWVAGLPADWLAIVARTLARLPGAGAGPPAASRALVAVLGGWCLVAVVVRGRRRRDRAMLGPCPP
jgi:competence protein ComEC